LPVVRASNVRSRTQLGSSQMHGGVHNGKAPTSFQAVVVAASTGGMRALFALLAPLPADFPVPILVVHHGGNAGLALLLARRTELPVRLATLGAPVSAHGVSVLPAAMSVTTVGAGQPPRFTPSDSALRPADQALVAMAGHYGPLLIAVVLTGRLDDGARGTRAVKRSGGRVLVQDPNTAQEPAMPTAAMATGCLDFVMPLDRLGTALIALAMAPGGADLFAVAAPAWAAYA